MSEVLPTTVDNPFDPFTQWDDWKRFDEEKKHFTWNLIARISQTSDDLSEADYNQAIDDAIDELVRINASGMHRKVYKNEANRGEG